MSFIEVYIKVMERIYIANEWWIRTIRSKHHNETGMVNSVRSYNRDLLLFCDDFLSFFGCPWGHYVIIIALWFSPSILGHLEFRRYGKSNLGTLVSALGPSPENETNNYFTITHKVQAVLTQLNGSKHQNSSVEITFYQRDL